MQSDKTEWVDGEWNDEPDELHWKTEAGLDGLICRNFGGSLCGYVGVPKEHIYFGTEYQEVSYDITCHGGLTFSGDLNGFTLLSDYDDTLWWLGFDCAHGQDVCPKYYKDAFDMSFEEATYKNIEYVKKEVENLAMLLK
tara:strand:+ start:237 stop:653 length:417 start_codon:yes stop_codon:yes gene_type:complete